jgi:hypothetical protein
LFATAFRCIARHRARLRTHSAPRPDSRSLKLLKNATRVEVFRIYDKTDPDIKEKPQLLDNLSVSGFPVWAQGKDQGNDFASRLAEVLNDKQTYTDVFVRCFWPGVAFRAWKDDEYIDIVICFKCENLYCGPPREENSTAGNVSFFRTPARPRLVQLAKEAFPDDKEIQALPESGWAGQSP